MKNILLFSLLFLFSLSMFGQQALEQEASAHQPWDVSQNAHMVQPKFKAVICRETEEGKMFSDFYFLESKSDENYYYLSNTVIDGKGVRVENVKKVLKKNVYSIYELVHTDLGTSEGN